VAVKATGLQLGRDFRAVTVSFDPAERADAAKEKQATLLDLLGRGARADDWPFLHGDRKAIDAITDATGFYYYRDPLSGEFAHLAALIVLTPDGRVSRYLYGVGFTGRDLRLALVEAGQGQTGSAFERILLKCYRFDGTTHRYELAIRNYMRAGGAAIGLAVAIFLAKLWRRERRRAE
jgi:protein SCO1/2